MIDSFKHERGLEDGDRYRVDSPPFAEPKLTAMTQERSFRNPTRGTR
jgi:hypothetical protein